MLSQMANLNASWIFSADAGNLTRFEALVTEHFKFLNKKVLYLKDDELVEASLHFKSTAICYLLENAASRSSP